MILFKKRYLVSVYVLFFLFLICPAEAKVEQKNIPVKGKRAITNEDIVVIDSQNERILVHIVDFDTILKSKIFESLNTNKLVLLQKRLSSIIKDKDLIISYFEDQAQKEMKTISAHVFFVDDKKNIVEVLLDQKTLSELKRDDWFMEVQKFFGSRYVFVAFMVILIYAILALFPGPMANLVHKIFVKSMDYVKETDIAKDISNKLSKTLDGISEKTDQIPGAISSGLAQGVGELAQQISPELRKIGPEVKKSIDNLIEKLDRYVNPSPPAWTASEPPPIYHKEPPGQDFQKAESILNTEMEKSEEKRDYERIKLICDDLKSKHSDSELPDLYTAVYYYIPQNRYSDAERALRRARKLNDENPEVPYFIGTIYEDKGVYVRTKEFMIEAISKDRNPPKYHITLAYAKWYLWDKSDKESFKLIEEAIEHCEYAAEKSVWQTGTTELYIKLQNALLFYLCIIGGEKELAKAAATACRLEKVDFEQHEFSPYIWDSLGAFYLTLYFKKFQCYKDADDCSKWRVSIVEENQMENLQDAKKWLKKAVDQGTLDIVVNVDGTVEGEDSDIMDRYKTVLALLDKYME